MTKKKKIVYIISFIDKALIYEWTAAYFAKSDLFEVKYLLMNPGETALSKFMELHGIPHRTIPYSGKKNFVRALAGIFRYLKKEKPDIVNTNLIDASLAGQIAAYLAGVPRRIHSRHYSSLHHAYFPHALKYDRLMNSLSTEIVVATKMVRDILVEKEHVKPGKVKVINYGFDLKRFMEVDPARVLQLKEKYFAHHKNKFPYPVIGVISRFIHWKGIQYIIPAFKNLLTDYPGAHLILANASGDYTEEIRKLETELPEGSFTEIKFEPDSPALYKMFDVFVHVPIDHHSEAFGQIYIEALAAKVPSVFTISGVANDFIIDRKNARVVAYQNSQEITEAIKSILTDPELKNTMVENGKKEVFDKFKFEQMAEKLVALYSDSGK